VTITRKTLHGVTPTGEYLAAKRTVVIHPFDETRILHSAGERVGRQEWRLRSLNDPAHTMSDLFLQLVSCPVLEDAFVLAFVDWAPRPSVQRFELTALFGCLAQGTLVQPVSGFWSHLDTPRCTPPSPRCEPFWPHASITHPQQVAVAWAQAAWAHSLSWLG
jgi:hypothetical protein